MIQIGRRKVLRGFMGAAVALPWLEAMQPLRRAHAEGPLSNMGTDGRPKRFVILYTSSGQGAEWFGNSMAPDGTLALSDCLSPLERHKDRLLLLDGVNMRSAFSDPSNVDEGHAKPGMHMLTCMPTIKGDTGGHSIDQEIARKIGSQTKFPSLELSVTGSSLSSSGANIYKAPLSDPSAIWRKLFSDFKTDPLVIERLRARRRSILDGVRGDLEKLVARVGGEDRRKVEAHLDGVREIEKRISGASGAGVSTCAVPAMPPPNPAKSSEEYLSACETHMDLLVLSLACDLTRVASLPFAGKATGLAMPWIGITNLHMTSHSDPKGRNKISKWHAELFAGFFDRLKAVKEGSGTLLDNTLTYWCTEHGTGDHNYDRMPILIAGSAGGYFKTGRRLTFGTTPCPPGGTKSGTHLTTPCVDGAAHGELFVSFLNAMGVPATSFGLPEYCRGPIPGLTA